jgi:hypothetical protein
VLVTAGRLHAPRAADWLLLFRVNLHDVWDPAPVSLGEDPRARREDFTRDAWGREWESHL